MIGDFNKILSINDKQGDAIHIEFQMDAFWMTTDHCQISSLSHSSEAFAWGNNSLVACNLKKKIDWSMSNSLWSNLFPRAHLEHLDFYQSDHKAMKITLNLSNVTEMIIT